MSSETKGLRFDLYERIHVPSFLPAVAELDEMELLPEIECVEEHEMVVMRGHFRFTADYVSKEENAQDMIHSFEHLIPVDITLPRQRIDRIEDVWVAIESYDTESVSDRELNLNVIIELRGVRRDLPAVVSVDEEQYPTIEIEEDDDPVADTSVLLTELSEIEPEKIESEKIEPEKIEPIESATEIVTSEVAPEPVNTAISNPNQSAATTSSGMEWTKMFLRSEASERTSSQQKRMCIVQREESIERIANRYDVTVQDLIQFNRLQDQQIQVGQIVYIPLRG
jgi:stage VI sporulation protein D